MATILLVDDERSIRITLSAFLSKAGHEVEAVEDSPTALARLEAGSFDVVITDYILPGMGHEQYFTRLAEATKAIPVIVITGEPGYDSAVMALRVRASSYLCKPLQRDAVVAAAAKAWDERREILQHEADARDVERHQHFLKERVEETSRALIASEARFRALFHDAPIPYWVQDHSGMRAILDRLAQAGVTDWRTHFRTHPADVDACMAAIRLVDCNMASCRLFGIDRPEDMPLAMSQFFTETSLERFREQITEVAAGRRTFEDMLHIRIPSGQELVVKVFIVIPPESTDTFERVLITFVDITREALLEQKLAEAKRRMRALIDASPQAMLLIDPDGAILTCNHSAAARFGATPEALVGRPALSLTPANAAQRQAAIRRVLETGRPYVFTDQRDGHTFRNTLNPLLDSEGRVSAIAVFADEIRAPGSAEGAG